MNTNKIFLTLMTLIRTVSITNATEENDSPMSRLEYETKGCSIHQYLGVRFSDPPLGARVDILTTTVEKLTTNLTELTNALGTNEDNAGQETLFGLLKQILAKLTETR